MDNNNYISYDELNKFSPRKNTIEIEGTYHSGSDMSAKISLATTGESSDIVLTRCDYSTDVTETDYRNKDISAYHFSAERVPLATIKRYHDTDISLMEKLNMFFGTLDFNTIYEVHEHKKLTRGKTLTEAKSCVNRMIDAEMYEKNAGYRMPTDPITVVPYSKHIKKTNKYILNAADTAPVIYPSYFENGDICKISTNFLNSKFYGSDFSLYFDNNGRMNRLSLHDNNEEGIALNSYAYMYGIGTVDVEYIVNDASPRDRYHFHQTKDTCSKGSICYITKEGVEWCNPFASKNEMHIVNNIIYKNAMRDIPEEIKSYVFDKSLIFVVRMIAINTSRFYQVSYDGTDIQYDSIYNNIGGDLIYMKASYTRDNGNRIEIEDYYDTSFFIVPKVISRVVNEYDPVYMNVKSLNMFGDTTITREINYLDPNDKSKMKFKVSIDTSLNTYHNVINFINSLKAKEISSEDYLEAVDISIDTGSSVMTVPKPEDVYIVLSNLIEACSNPIMKGISGRNSPIIEPTRLPYGNNRNRIFDTVAILLNPEDIRNWIKAYYSDKDKKEETEHMLELISHIDFDSFIMPPEKVMEINERLDEVNGNDEEEDD